MDSIDKRKYITKIIVSVFVIAVTSIVFFMVSDIYHKWMWGVIYSIVVLTLIINIVISVVKLNSDKQEDISKFHGKEYTAEVTGITSKGSKSSNPMHHYHIEYKWIDCDEIEREGVTDYIYTYTEAISYKSERYIKIKARGDKSVIVSRPTTDYINSPKEKPKEIVECKYCGQALDGQEKKCPSCGAQISKKK